ncbi:MAG: PLP-dependent aminotransferase family protein [Polaromonas sp.]|uniref:aminotransferase-like domain-containing protein n=1 Tax=Polaromonas sp. TaxID=1869339 RepID=UPI002735B32F|nr:PLP-dependent aminotransferase family protein [Polaromonas sp.]MDP3798494.1 PLP-dependent aminotransferase family protein [Polaromonas sp.]
MFNELFTPRFAQPAGSPIRELFPYLSRPGMISFAGGYPSPELFDAEGLREASARALTDGAASLQYGPTEGMPRLRNALAEHVAGRGIRCTAADVLVTTGSQQAFDLLVRVFVQPGDVVYVETPAYPATIQTLRLAGAAIQEVPVDEDGLDTTRLAVMLEAAPRTRRPKLLYCVPTFSNPCGTLLPTARRQRLVELARQYGFVVVEDDPYGELTFSDDATEPLYCHGAGPAGACNPVIYLSSLSKTVAPALRVGWMIAPPEVLRRCAIAKQTADLCTSPLNQLIAAEYFASGRYLATVRHARAEYRRRMEAMVGALERDLPGRVRLVRPKGGMFVWVAHDAGVDPQSLFCACVEAGVLFVPGRAFYPCNPDPHTMRLSFAAPGVDDILEGVSRLTRAFDAALAVGVEHAL